MTPPAAVPGDLGLAMPHRHLSDIVEMLESLETIAPGISSDHTLLYGIEVKFYSFKIEAGEGFQTKIPKLYVAGDGSGYTRGLLQSSMQGVVVARHLAGRLTPSYSARELSDEDRRWEACLKMRFDDLCREVAEPEEETQPSSFTFEK